MTGCLFAEAWISWLNAAVELPTLLMADMAFLTFFEIRLDELYILDRLSDRALVTNLGSWVNLSRLQRLCPTEVVCRSGENVSVAA